VKLAQNDFQGAQTLLRSSIRQALRRTSCATGRRKLTPARVNLAEPAAGPDCPTVAVKPACAKAENIDATWKALTAMTKDQANALVINADENVLQGWLDLQRMWFDNRNDPTMLKAG
jgi:outer membrane PBP1 activator LpoA protein